MNALWKDKRIEAIVFDLGDTLIEYAGLPMSWEKQYSYALQELAEHLEIQPSESQMANLISILNSFNTRTNPREVELQFSIILHGFLKELRIDHPVDANLAARAFFSFFRRRVRCFSDTAPCLENLQFNGVRIGVLTDVPYGMPRNLVEEDMMYAGVFDFIEQLVTSVDIGYRKPNPAGLFLLADALKINIRDMIFVGNEQKDIETALAGGCTPILIDRRATTATARSGEGLLVISSLSALAF